MILSLESAEVILPECRNVTRTPALSADRFRRVTRLTVGTSHAQSSDGGREDRCLRDVGGNRLRLDPRSGDGAPVRRVFLDRPPTGLSHLLTFPAGAWGGGYRNLV